MLAALVLSLLLAPSATEREARLSIDVKDADVVDIVRLLAHVAGFQVVFQPGVSCKLTLTLAQVRWQTALELSLRSCNLGRDEEDGVLRIAPVDRLTEELAARRRLDEERRSSGALRSVRFRLSYARAAEMAPIVKRFLSPRGEVTYDERTNTLYVTDIR